MKSKFRAVQKLKSIRDKKIVYEFEVYKDQEKLKMGEYPVPIMKDGQYAIDPDTKVIMYESVPIYATMTVSVDPGSSEHQIRSAIKRQLLDFVILDERPEPNLSQSPDLGEVTLDD